MKDLAIDSSSRIIADGEGYVVGLGSATNDAGSGYGGRGGSHNLDEGGVTYGSEREPIDFGSGKYGTRGGGAIRISVENNFLNNGIVSANGVGGVGGTSGGSIYVTTKDLEGNGLFRANGANGKNFTVYASGGGGGGGRIALYYKTSNFTGSFQALGGAAVQGRNFGQLGTIVYEELENSTTAILDFVDEDGYMSDIESPGVHPNKGVANEDELTFKVMYIHPKDLSPENVSLVVKSIPSFENEYYNDHFIFPDENIDNLVFEKGDDLGFSFGRQVIGFDRGVFDLTQGFDEGDETFVTFTHDDSTAATTTFIIKNMGVTTPNTSLTIRLEGRDSSDNIIASTTQEIILPSGTDFLPVSLGVSIGGNTTITHLRFSVTESSNTEAWLKGITIERTLAMSQEDPSSSNFSMGEKYFLSDTFPKGSYSYQFTATADGEKVVFPEEELSFTTGFSSVAFLPGIKASRLYKEGTIFENQLWEPNTDEDVEKLFLDSSGNSINSDIYTRDVIDQANIIPSDPLSIFRQNFYISFIQDMNKLANNGIIANWKALPYDWRLDYDDILESGSVVGADGSEENISYLSATSSPYIVQEIERLARASASGKVTIVAHSNGGLLAKKLIDRLEAKGEADIIENLILVAAPQLGTPKAIVALLHGYEEDIPKNFGFFFSKEVARRFGKNMVSAYNLLPSAAYMNRVKDIDESGVTQDLTTVIEFDSSLDRLADTIAFRD